jgi:hypothetical protein
LTDIRTATVKPLSRTRSRVSNGSTAFLNDVDGRSALARRYRDILADLKTDLGGDPSTAKVMICRRAATLAVWCEQAEAKMAEGQPVNIAEFTTASNALRRLLADIGLERKSRDVTPSTPRSRIMEGAEAA